MIFSKISVSQQKKGFQRLLLYIFIHPKVFEVTKLIVQQTKIRK